MSLNNFSKTIFLFFAVMVLTLGGCARAPLRVSPPPSAIQVGPIGRPIPVTHLVEHGQTLYRIAKKYGVDFRDLMRVNQIHDVSLLKVGQTLVIPGQYIFVQQPVLVPAGAGMSASDVARLLGPRHLGSDWRTITVHHSATRQGSARAFHRDHLRRKMGGLFYHFVIGNGTQTSDGEVEVGWRWKKQVKANRPYDIQICLVGNFSETQLSEAQFATLVHLIGILQEQYGIPIQNIRRHQDVKGKNTECPGKFFPFHRLLMELSKNSIHR